MEASMLTPRDGYLTSLLPYSDEGLNGQEAAET
jgi:hypothetical protein